MNALREFKTKQLSLYDEFDIKVYETSEWTLKPHKHSFFEIIYVLFGNGIFVVQGEEKEYTESSLFLLTAEYNCTFLVKETTVFCIITFTKTLFAKKEKNIFDFPDFSEMFKQIEKIFYNLDKDQYASLLSNTEKKFIHSIFEQLSYEVEIRNGFYHAIIENIILLLLKLIVRNLQLSQMKVNITSSNETAAGLLNYIQENAGDNKKLSLAKLAKHFGKSKETLQQNFKKATGTTIKDYIIEMRLVRVKLRLLYTDMTIAEIADEFHYNDESHLNKSFKARYGTAPSRFRDMYGR